MPPSNAHEQCSQAMPGSNATYVTYGRTNEEPPHLHMDGGSTSVTRGRTYDDPQSVTCPTCGTDTPATDTQGRPRRFCSRHCCALWVQTHREAGPKRTMTDRCDDAEELLAVGESPEQIAKRLNTTVGALAKLLRRHGRGEAARPFERLSKRVAA